MEHSYFSQASEGNAPVEFWLRELRTPQLLVEVAAGHPELAQRMAEVRPAVRAALHAGLPEVARLLEEEEREERREDRDYWQPLRRELEQLRRAGRISG